jgi:hypothetical protein
MTSSIATDRDPRTAAAREDVVRQVVVLVGAIVATAAAFWGSGATGGPEQQEVGDGALAADATPVAPAAPAFSIWSVIYTGLAVYAVWQALPAQRTRELHRRIGWWALASMVLNALWIGVVQVGLLELSVPVIAALLAVLAVLMVALVRRGRPDDRFEAVVVDGTMGLYLGWVCVATVANVAAVLASVGFTDPPGGADLWGVLAVAVAGGVGVALAVWSRGRVAIGLAIAWGLAWIAVGRTAGELVSAPTGIAAGVAAGVVLVVTALVAVRRRPDAR